MSIVTRFPPSPTGFMHIGNARTALFNWLFAKHNNGKMLLRIEDTDRARHSDEAVEAIIKGMEWLDLGWDGDIISQFSRQERHIEVANQLLTEGKAYKCYCSPEELEQMREDAQKEGRATIYDRRWRDKNEADAPADIKPVIRIKAPLDGETTINDEVQGSITVQNEQLDDFIILRSDNSPTYMLAVVVDDNDMGITHVLRGDDHMNNAFRQKVVINAMGWDTPTYGHLPMILGQDGSKLSKRHGAVSLEDFKALGYLPQTVFNYLLRLGWSHGDDEIISREQAIEWFDLKNVNKSPAKFDYDKIENLNAHYIKEMDNDVFCNLLREYWSENTDDTTILASLNTLADELKNRAKTMVQAAKESSFLLKADNLDYDENATRILSEASTDVLSQFKDALSALDDFTSENIQATTKSFSKEHLDGKMGKIGMPLRAALTGSTQSPSIFLCAEVLGKDEVLKRIGKAVEVFNG